MSGSTSSLGAPCAYSNHELEELRSKHEHLERLEQLIMEELKTEQRTPMEKLLQGHRLRRLTDSIILKTRELVQTDEKEDLDAVLSAILSRLEQSYDKKDGEIKYAIAPHGDPTATFTNLSDAFFSRLEELHEYHRIHPSECLADAHEALLKDEPVIGFSVEECSGRFLDLHDMYNKYISSDFGERVEYSAYLDVFSQPDKIPRKLKLSRQYAEYMEALLEYLIYFFQRTEPLQDLDRILHKVETDFEEQYAEGKVKGGENHHDQEHEPNPSHPAVVDLDCYTRVEELVDVELEKLTKALVALGLSTSGTQQQCAERLFLTKQARLEKKHSLMEAKMKKLCDLLDEAIERTKQNVEKKRKALTFEVMEEEEAHTESESVAMGWDGKPIPYWLYKLGLGQEYKCEICGNYSYGGKRAFERHFEEWRHARGLLRLGIKGKVNRITLVEEAKDLWNTLPESQKVRLRADGNLRPLPRLKDQEIKESNPRQAPTGVAIPPPDIKTMVERTAFFLAREGLETERKVTDKYENEAIFSFLNSSDPYHAFYQHRLTEYRAQNQDGAQATGSDATPTTNPGYGDSRTFLPAEFMVPPPPLESHKFAYRLPVGMTPEELDIIKLTAQFLARYGNVFWEGFKKSVSMDPQFEFIRNPTDGRFTLFSGLVQAYGEVLCPQILKEKLRKKAAADMETILENCFHRVQWDRSRRSIGRRNGRSMGRKKVASERRRIRIQDLHIF